MDRDRLLKYLKHCLDCLPNPYSREEANRVTLLYFVVGGLDVCDGLDLANKKAIIEWVYSLQVLPTDKDGINDVNPCGFRGGPSLGNSFQRGGSPVAHAYDYSHVASTYCSLNALLICGDDLSRVNKTAIIQALSNLRNANGSFRCTSNSDESDVRFLYCAVCISYLLNDWSAIDKEAAIQYITSLQTYEGGFGQQPESEAHGGPSFCVIASLALMDRLDALPRKNDVIRWLLQRQISGFQGRVNKVADTCYSWWVGASIRILGFDHMIDKSAMEAFHLQCATKYGGFGKNPEAFPDVLHTYFSTAIMCMIHENDQSDVGWNWNRLNFPIQLTERAAQRIFH